MRAVSSSLMAALIVVALFWGNCLSCPQVLLSLRKMKQSHECCKRGQKPAANNTCTSQGLQHFVKAEPAPAPLPALSAEAPAPAAEIPAAAPAFEPVAVASGPPPPSDRLSLHSSFRI
jgi:predicted lipid-binding transport protein (Tim44 family)